MVVFNVFCIKAVQSTEVLVTEASIEKPPGMYSRVAFFVLYSLKA